MVTHDDHDDDDARTYARTTLNARCVRTHVSETFIDQHISLARCWRLRAHACTGHDDDETDIEEKPPEAKKKANAKKRNQNTYVRTYVRTYQSRVIERSYGLCARVAGMGAATPGGHGRSITTYGNSREQLASVQSAIAPW